MAQKLMSDRVYNIPSSPIHMMTRLAAQIPNSISLSWAKPLAGTPEHINKAACDAIEKGLVSGYSTSLGLPELREAISEKLKIDNKIAADPNSEIMVAVGAIEALGVAVMALTDPGDEVILPSPNYSTHAQQVVLASAVPKFVPTIEEEGFRLDIEGIRRTITKKTKAIMFSTPCNPTGAVFPEKDLRALAEIALGNNISIITDEAYEYFVFDDNKHFSIASIPNMKDRVVSVFTFTKTYAMTGWRVGYAVASAELIKQMQKVHIPFAICAPVVSQYAALAALRGPQDCVAQFRQKYLELRNLICERLDRLNNVFEYHKPEGSYCIFPRIKTDDRRESLSFCKKLLQEAGVSVTPGVGFGPTAEGHVRMTFCCFKEMIEEAFDRMYNYFNK